MALHDSIQLCHDVGDDIMFYFLEFCHGRERTELDGSPLSKWLSNQLSLHR